jgi:hypothetical protein
MLERALPKEYRTRQASLAGWNDFRQETVLKVLGILADILCWKRDDVFRLRPDDKLWPIYHSYYPQTHWWQRLKPDMLEMETLLRDLHKEAPQGRTIDLHPEVTLAELVRAVAR